jgi:hypothetical protein
LISDEFAAAEVAFGNADALAEAVGADPQLSQPPHAPDALSAEAASRCAVSRSRKNAGKLVSVAAIALVKRRRSARGPNA